MNRGNPPPLAPGQQQLPSLSEFDIMSNTYHQPIRALDFTRDNIGRSVRFTTGQFAGRTIRAELIELQKADLGRKYARKDRRPLDPPPVVQLKLFDVSNYGTAMETHREFDSYDERGFGLLCHIDLFQVPLQEDSAPSGSGPNQSNNSSHSHPSTSATTSASASPTPTTPSSSYPYSHAHSPASNFSLPSIGSSSNRSGYTLPPPHPSASSGAYTLPPPAPPLHGVTLPPISSLDPASSSIFNSVHLPPMQAPDFSRSGLTLPPLTRPQAALSPYSYPPPAPPGHVPHIQHQPPPKPIVSTEGKAMRAPPGAPEGVVAYLGDHAIMEEDKCTESLVGARFCQASSLEWQGRKVLMFVFSDIAVQIEGSFILRYRVFNLFAQVEGAMDIPILAECYGGPFRIYSTKEFPGLRPSTELTKHLSLFGVRLNLRETERKRRRTGRSSDAASPDSAGRGRRGGRRGKGRENTADDSDNDSSDDE